MSKKYIEQLEIRAEQGDVEAQYELGLSYLAGLNIEKNTEKARSWFKKASDSNETRAMLLLGRMNEQGIGGEKDTFQASSLYHKAINIIGNRDVDSFKRKRFYEASISQEIVMPASPSGGRDASSIHVDEEEQSNLLKNTEPASSIAEKNIEHNPEEKAELKMASEKQLNAVNQCLEDEPKMVNSVVNPKPIVPPLNQIEQTDPDITEEDGQHAMPSIDNQNVDQDQAVEIEDTPARDADAPIADSHWECHEPPEGAWCPKPHLESKFDRESGLYIARRRGRSHEHDGKFCDDDGDYWVHPSGWTVLAVADGAGSAEYSREGSRIAVRTAIEGFKGWFTQEIVEACDACLQDWEARQGEFQQIFYYQFYEICKRAITNIKNVAEENGLKERQFSTTLLLTVTRTLAGKTYAASLWIGDGAMVAYRSGASRLLGSADSGEYVGQTRFLDAHYLQNHYPSSVSIAALEQVEALLLMTDGVSDPKFKSDADLVNAECWDDFWKSLEPELAKENPALALLEWLHFFERGYHDDRTLLVWQAKADQ